MPVYKSSPGKKSSESITAKDVMDKTGLSKAGAKTRLHRYRKGEITKKGLFKVVGGRGKQPVMVLMPDGKTQGTLADAEKASGIAKNTLYFRHRKGEDLYAEKRRGMYVDGPNGKVRLSDLARETGQTHSALHYRATVLGLRGDALVEPIRKQEAKESLRVLSNGHVLIGAREFKIGVHGFMFELVGDDWRRSFNPEAQKLLYGKVLPVKKCTVDETVSRGFDEVKFGMWG